MSKAMSKSERRAARKAGTLQDWRPAPPEVPRRARGVTRRAVARWDAMERWARRYDALNGAPESEEDR